MRTPRRPPFARDLTLPGWSAGSAWGYDEVYECYWAELRGSPSGRRAVLRIGPERLIVTLAGLARVVARNAGIEPVQAYLALTA